MSQSQERILRDRFRATLLGAAIGDALAFPYEGASRESLRRAENLTRAFKARKPFPAGCYSDDTQMLLAVAQAINESGKIEGQSVARCLTSIWEQGAIFYADPVCSEAVARHKRGVPWMMAGTPAGLENATCTAAVRAAPVGLFFCDRFDQLTRAASTQSLVTHQDPGAIAGSIAMAAAVALSLPVYEKFPCDTFCWNVAATVRGVSQELASHIEQLPQYLSFEPQDASRVISNIGQPPDRPKSHVGISLYVFPAVLMALYACIKSSGDFDACMNIVIRSGGFTASVACMAGALLGARFGTGALPKKFRDRVIHGGALVQVADGLFERKFLPIRPADACAVTAGAARHPPAGCR